MYVYICIITSISIMFFNVSSFKLREDNRNLMHAIRIHSAYKTKLLLDSEMRRERAFKLALFLPELFHFLINNVFCIASGACVGYTSDTSCWGGGG